MNRLLTAFALGGLVWFGITRYQTYTYDLGRGEASLATEKAVGLAKPLTEDRGNQFSCDGRKYCSEMTSCEEAEFFLAHCPEVEMDGDSDGVPCERQWCDKW